MDAESPQLPAWVMFIAGIGFTGIFAGVLALNLLSDPISPIGVAASLILFLVGLWVTLQVRRSKEPA